MRRRKFITLAGGAAIAWPFAARAQQQTMPVVGVLDSIGSAATLPAFRDDLAQIGYVAGRNVALDVRSTDNYGRLPGLARDLASGPVAAIAALGGPSAPAAKAASATIPIVFTIGVDPLELGLVASISRPGGNITGVTFFTAQLLQKQIGLVHELLPNARAFGLLLNPENPRARADLASAEGAARSIDIDLHVANASATREFESAFGRVSPLLRCICSLVALNGGRLGSALCLVSEVLRTSQAGAGPRLTAGFDPQETLAAKFCCDAQHRRIQRCGSMSFLA